MYVAIERFMPPCKKRHKEGVEPWPLPMARSRHDAESVFAFQVFQGMRLIGKRVFIAKGDGNVLDGRVRCKASSLVLDRYKAHTFPRPLGASQSCGPRTHIMVMYVVYFFVRSFRNVTQRQTLIVCTTSMFLFLFDIVSCFERMPTGRVKRDSLLFGEEQDLHPAQRLPRLPRTRLQGDARFVACLSRHDFVERASRSLEKSWKIEISSSTCVRCFGEPVSHLSYDPVTIHRKRHRRTLGLSG